jgi:stalled ribosome rescue protein Dom34
MSNNEFKKNRIEENDLQAYYKSLAEKLEGYDEILLFGPGEAKKQFKNVAEQLHVFQNKVLHVETSDKLTSNQLLEFVREYFKLVKK